MPAPKIPPAAPAKPVSEAAKPAPPTSLPRPVPAVPQKSNRRISPLVATIIAIVAILAIGGAVIGLLSWLEARESKASGLPAGSPGPGAGTSTKKPKTPKATNPDAAGGATTPSTSPKPNGNNGTDPQPPKSRVPGPDRPKATSDLKYGTVTLEKANGNSLVYATGTLTNDSGHQRYGVRIEVALSDATGKAVGTAKDYRRQIDPGETWTFRALILDSRARSGAVQSVTEDP